MKKIYMLLAAVLLVVITGCGSGGDTAQAPPSTLKAITLFYLNGIVGTIDEPGKTIAVTMPYGTDVTSLVAMFMTTGASVKVDTTVQKSETTVNNFTTPLVYTVTAADGSSVTYTVTVTVAAAKPRAFTAFSLTVDTETVVGTINETEKKISVRMPPGTDVTALVAKFTTTAATVTVGSNDQTSGVTPNDFTHPVLYTVTDADSSTTYTVKINDYVETKREYDSDRSGTPDTVYYYSYYTDGRKAKDQIDSDNNDTIDDVVIYGYDADYNNIKVEYDLNNNGTIDAVYYYTYDANGKVTKTEFDLYNDGTIDSVNYYTYVNGKKTKDEYDKGKDGTIDTVYYYTYDASGNLIKEEYDDDNNSATTNYIVNYAYDVSGNLINKTADLNNDGFIDSVSYIYDSGNLIKENYDYSNNGSIEHFITYTYENGNMKTKVYDYWSYTYYWALI